MYLGHHHEHNDYSRHDYWTGSLEALANGNAEERERRKREERAAINRRCNINRLASEWTKAKYGSNIGTPRIPPTRGPDATYEAHVARFKKLGYPPRFHKYWYECRDGYPEYMQFQFQQAAQKLIPTAEETAEAFVKEVKEIAPPLVEKPAVVPAPVGVPAPAPPPPPVPTTQRAPVSVVERFRDERIPQPSATMPVEAPVPEPAAQPGAGIGAALAIGIPIALMMAGG